MKVNHKQSPNFGHTILVHKGMTKKSLESTPLLDETEKQFVSRCSEIPDLLKPELVDMSSGHFYNPLNIDPSFGTVNDFKNNALSRCLKHSREALKTNDRELFLRKIGYAAHYLQDASTPPHVEGGNYAQKFFRLPMHIQYEKGKKHGELARLNEILSKYRYEPMPYSNTHEIQYLHGRKKINKTLENIKSLFHNLALYSAQPENHVRYTNIKEWSGIQDRTIAKGINATRVYFEYMLQFIPKK